jgi:uncharacterized membrane protein
VAAISKNLKPLIQENYPAVPPHSKSIKITSQERYKSSSNGKHHFSSINLTVVHGRNMVITKFQITDVNPITVPLTISKNKMLLQL